MPGFIPVEEAAALLDAGALVVDVRTPGEWEEGHAEASLLLPLNELPARFGELPKERALLMVCRSGGRSEQAAMFLQAMGYERVFNLGPWQRNPRHQG
ncbi:MAG TPA: rhodanese-like domain-containing protein [Holophagaceae bacterium]|nr:rhodanese-like domain-containing protein [Holophagaceae bacterium]